MRPELFGLDHLMIATHDLPDVRRTYQRLGFTVTPYRANEPMGGGKTGGRGGNHLVMMTATDGRMANYLELAYADLIHAAPFVKTLLSRPPGLAMLVHSGQALRELDAAWQQAGLPPCSVYQHDAIFTDPATGVTDRIHFEVLVPSREQGPFAVNACRYFDLDHYRRPDWVNHANGAQRWSQVTIAHDDLEAVDAFVRKVYGAPPQRTADAISVSVGDQTFLAMDRAAFADRFGDTALRRPDGSPADTAIGVITRSLDETAAYLAAANVPADRTDTSVIVPAAECDGVIMTFNEGAA